MAYNKNKNTTLYAVAALVVIGGGIAWTFFTAKGKAWFATVKAKFVK
ncbi:hypothetical protein [Pedobacter jeongneungensis]|nr:hypothetical protein [Pedobacter jeongneungensis]